MAYSDPTRVVPLLFIPLDSRRFATQCSILRRRFPSYHKRIGKLSHRMRYFALRACTVILSLLLLLGVLEIVLRVAGYDPFAKVFSQAKDPLSAGLFRIESVFEGLDYELIPNADVEVWGTRAKINSHGLRDREYSLNKPPDTYRVLAIGDSITFGNKLPIEHTYPKYLESLFQDKGHDVEVLNFGVGGYNTLQEVIRLETLGLKFSPDHVIIGFCLNDIRVAALNRGYVKRMESYGSIIYRLRSFQFFAVRRDRYTQKRFMEETEGDAYFLERNAGKIADLSADNYLNDKMERLRKLLERGENTNAYRYIKGYASKPHVGVLRYAFEKLGQLRDEHDFRVAVAIVPYLSDDYPAVNELAYQIIRHEVTRMGFAVIELKDSYRTAGFEKLRFGEAEFIHPNQLGHKLMAAKIYEHLIGNSEMKAHFSSKVQ